MHSLQHPVRILIVDDATSLRTLLRSFLTCQGYEVVGELSSGYRILDTISSFPSDIGCLDHPLPDCSGIDLLKTLQIPHPCVAVVAEHRPGLTCIALDMPVMKGWQAIEKIRVLQLQTRALMITVRAGCELIVRAAQLCMRGYSLTPFEPRKAVGTFDALLSASQ